MISNLHTEIICVTNLIFSDKTEGVLEDIRDQKTKVGDALTLQNVIRDTMTEVSRNLRNVYKFQHLGTSTYVKFVYVD